MLVSSFIAVTFLFPWGSFSVVCVSYHNAFVCRWAVLAMTLASSFRAVTFLFPFFGAVIFYCLLITFLVDSGCSCCLSLSLLGPGYRLDHMPLIISQRTQTEGFDLHGGAMSSSGGKA